MNKVLIIITIFLFTGCYNYRELDTLAIATAVGIDKVGDEYQISSQVVNTQRSGNDTNTSGEQSKFVVYKTTGKTVQEALRKIVLESPRRIYGNHLQLLVVGEEFAKENISEIFDFFIRNPESRKQFIVTIAKGSKATDILETITPLETLSSKNIVDSIKADSKYLGLSEKLTFEDQMKVYLSNRQDMVMSSIEITGNKEQGDKTNTLKQSIPDSKVILSNTGIFSGNKLVGFLNEEQSLSTGYLNDSINNTIVTIQCEQNKYTTVEIMNSKTEYKPTNGELKIVMSVKSDGNISEVGCPAKLDEIDSITKIEQSIEEKIKNSINDTLNKTIHEYKTDSFGFLDIIYKAYPKYYYEIKDDWKNGNLQKLNIEINVDVTLKGKGNVVKVVS